MTLLQGPLGSWLEAQRVAMTAVVEDMYTSRVLAPVFGAWARYAVAPPLLPPSDTEASTEVPSDWLQWSDSDSETEGSPTPAAEAEAVREIIDLFPQMRLDGDDVAGVFSFASVPLRRRRPFAFWEYIRIGAYCKPYLEQSHWASWLQSYPCQICPTTGAI
jgi:hypothetical protein